MFGVQIRKIGSNIDLYHEGFKLKHEISASYLEFLISNGFLHANFDDLIGRTRLLPKKKNCSIMNLVCPS